MESSLSHHHRLPEQSPFDQFADPFDLANRHDPHNNGANPERPESWSSGENNDDSPLGDSGHDMDGATGGAAGANRGEGIAVHAGEPKKKRFVCPHCTRTFARSGHLQRHERSRTCPKTPFRKISGCMVIDGRHE